VSKFRWFIADQLGRLKSQCWADLVTWALDGSGGPRDLPAPPFSAGSCRLSALKAGSCYCGKFRSAASVGPLDGDIKPWRIVDPSGEQHG
jgi:hypothetical protein